MVWPWRTVDLCIWLSAANLVAMFFRLIVLTGLCLATCYWKHWSFTQLKVLYSWVLLTWVSTRSLFIEFLTAASCLVDFCSHLLVTGVGQAAVLCILRTALVSLNFVSSCLTRLYLRTSYSSMHFYGFFWPVWTSFFRVSSGSIYVLYSIR